MEHVSVFFKVLHIIANYYELIQLITHQVILSHLFSCVPFSVRKRQNIQK